MGDFQWTLTNRKKERDAMLIDREKKDLFMEMRRWTLMRVKRKKERRKRLNAQQAAEGHEAAVGKRRLTNKPQSQDSGWWYFVQRSNAISKELLNADEFTEYVVMR